MGKLKLLLLLLVLNLFCPVCLSAQERFGLEKREGHYYFTATIGDTPVELMMESGIPALLVGKDVYEACLKSSGLQFQPSAQKVRLLKQHKSLAKAIKRQKIALKDAFDAQGRLVAQGIYANSLSLLGRKYNDISIGVTDRMQSIGQLGFLGTPLFDSPVVFDFDKGVMILNRQ